MGLKKMAKKLSDYNERLERGKAEKIEPSHIKKVMEKIEKKAAQLDADIASEENLEKKDRLERKRRIAGEHIARAEWLLAQIE